MEKTHVTERDPDGNSYLRQVVSASRLREILRANGETLSRPRDFGPRDEWDVGGELRGGDPCPRCDQPLASCSPSGRGTAACDTCHTVYGDD